MGDTAVIDKHKARRLLGETMRAFAPNAAGTPLTGIPRYRRADGNSSRAFPERISRVVSPLFLRGGREPVILSAAGSLRTPLNPRSHVGPHPLSPSPCGRGGTKNGLSFPSPAGRGDQRGEDY